MVSLRVKLFPVLLNGSTVIVKRLTNLQWSQWRLQFDWCIFTILPMAIYFDFIKPKITMYYDGIVTIERLSSKSLLIVSESWHLIAVKSRIIAHIPVFLTILLRITFQLDFNKLRFFRWQMLILENRRRGLLKWDIDFLRAIVLGKHYERLSRYQPTSMKEASFSFLATHRFSLLIWWIKLDH